MSAPIDFYFDFSSPYGYLASEQIDALGARHGRAVMWHAIVLDAQFQPQGGMKIPAALMRTEYVRRDVERSSAYFGIPYKAPVPYPVHTEHAARAFQWLSDRNPDEARSFAHAVFRAYFVEGRNIAETAVLLEIAEALKLDREDVSAAFSDAATKARLKAEIDLAEARGVFGSPFFIVEGEGFWGNDRLPQLDRWLANGPF
ncbi:2-hydroxychromene-2-carboxylate isomerase [Zoogloea sp.]|jgi:2-hydroxychromene-2-carboxylate isomerase|uniref:2-hydroxychromene-2-carboxylate isomerase n=1 Tax=Zoogloea sp. TaxID=49181 RepID=UPI001B784272|nr:2-hydroxychromene-2-carboxylate isomerase [Zoogloea sp.]MBK6655804.1 2-hydroxychromene-2-carboxylate isomerase [Zoogloea sp.]MBK7847538.1 2-hydroxychromene-2-carboxylate isomerase [Zoogloea sp.]MBP7444884.1 2-hydroxychromene-2-carboxylate isomerase [Zoogloea sp.]HPI61128.1 2-hydroxychromene-2-carboxylate isomerase [Zoogloea sp.]